MLFYVCLGLGLVSLVLFLIQRKPEVSLKVLLFKTVTSVLFILTAFAAFYENSECNKILALLFFAGAVCGLLGDIWLDAKYLFPSEEKGLLKSGFISLMADIRPRHTMTLGLISATCSRRYSMQASSSSGRGSRFLGGRHLRILAIYTLLRSSPTASRYRSSN